MRRFVVVRCLAFFNLRRYSVGVSVERRWTCADEVLLCPSFTFRVEITIVCSFVVSGGTEVFVCSNLAKGEWSWMSEKVLSLCFIFVVDEIMDVRVDDMGYLLPNY